MGITNLTSGKTKILTETRSKKLTSDYESYEVIKTIKSLKEELNDLKHSKCHAINNRDTKIEDLQEEVNNLKAKIFMLNKEIKNYKIKLTKWDKEYKKLKPEVNYWKNKAEALEDLLDAKRKPLELRPTPIPVCMECGHPKFKRHNCKKVKR